MQMREKTTEIMTGGKRIILFLTGNLLLGTLVTSEDSDAMPQ